MSLPTPRNRSSGTIQRDSFLRMVTILPHSELSSPKSYDLNHYGIYCVSLKFNKIIIFYYSNTNIEQYKYDFLLTQKY